MMFPWALASLIADDSQSGRLEAAPYFVVILRSIATRQSTGLHLWTPSHPRRRLPSSPPLGGGECPGRGERATVFAVKYFVRSVLMKFLVYRLLECSPF
ncbi:MAG: hypothetical protein LBO00_05840, partial [Zoogloeaceae bacterium]|nr:hypothetical protein [Zoogloeaceae bacterium]